MHLLSAIGITSGGRGGPGRPWVQPKEGAQKTEIWGKYCINRAGKKKLFE